MSTATKINWSPSENFPIDIESAPLESILGAVLAVCEHQQRVAMSSKHDGSVANTFHLPVINNPSVYMPVLVEKARHHENKIKRRNLGLQHADLLDALIGCLPEELPRFLPRTRRWLAERSYRIVREHMKTTHDAFKLARDTKPDPDEDEKEQAED